MKMNTTEGELSKLCYNVHMSGWQEGTHNA